MVFAVVLVATAARLHQVAVRCRKVLEKFEIAELEEGHVTTSYEQQGDDDEFYHELKAKVNHYFKSNNVRSQYYTQTLACIVLPSTLTRVSS